MTPTLKTLRIVVLAGVVPLAMSYAPSIAAATVTLADLNCDSFKLDGTPGNQTLTCVVLSVPVCQVNGPSSGQVGSTIQLTASCTGQPTSYKWSGGNCTTGSTCNATSGDIGPVSYSVTATNNVGQGEPSPNKTVTWSAQPVVTKPSGCTLTPSQTPVSSGATITLTSECSGGSAPTSWIWTGSGTQGSTTKKEQLVFIGATTTFTVTPQNSAGAGNIASTTVTVSAANGGGTIQACAGFTRTKVIDAEVPANSGPNQRYFTEFGDGFINGASPGFAAHDALIVRFTAPPSDGYFNIGMKESGSGETGARTYRTMSLSTKPCDFTIPKSSDALWAYEDTGFSLNLSSDGSRRTNLQPGVTYYINVKNYAFGDTLMCSGTCDVFFTFANPTP